MEPRPNLALARRKRFELTSLRGTTSVHRWKTQYIMSDRASATSPTCADFSMRSIEHWSRLRVRTTRLSRLPMIPNTQIEGATALLTTLSTSRWLLTADDMFADLKKIIISRVWTMPNVMAALPNIDGALC